MDWKRGLLLAAIHVAISVPLVLSIQARTESYAREHPRLGPLPSPSQESHSGETFTFDPCNGIVDYPPREIVVRLSNLPATVVTGWRLACQSRWSMSGRFGLNFLWTPTLAELPKIRMVDTTFLILIPIQWLLMGAFPLVRPKHWYGEPGIFITLCAALGAILAIFPSLESLPEGPAALAGIMWFLWFGWLAWKAVRFLWRSTLKLIPQPAR